MADRDFFEHKRPLAGGGSLSCDEWEILLAEDLDGLMPATSRAAFDAHAASCAVCGELREQSRQGQEWLQFLGAEPEVPAGMVERIVSKTSGAAVGPLALNGGPIPVAAHVLPLPVRRVMWDSRMLMTAAMAFFSIALTLNLAGVRLTNLRLSDLTPASLEMNLTRQFYGAKGSLVRYYDNLRLVYEVESRVRDLRRTEQMRQAAPERRAVPANPSGNGHKNGGRLEPSTKVPNQVPINGALWGSPALASAGSESMVRKEQENFNETEQEVASFAVFWNPDHAKGGLA